jgi:hypothetical protein
MPQIEPDPGPAPAATGLTPAAQLLTSMVIAGPNYRCADPAKPPQTTEISGNPANVAWS